MIIKSISHTTSLWKSTRKKIEGLLNYIHDPNKMFDEAGHSCVVKRYLSGYGDIASWTDQLVENDNRKTFNHAKRVVMRHEIFSFSPHSSPYITREALMDITKRYLEQRTESPSVAVAHYEEGKPIHVHCAIAGVRVDNGKSTRISKKAFKAFKIEMETYIQERYPDIHRTSYIDHDPSKDRQSTMKRTRAEDQMKKSGVISRKEQLVDLIAPLAQQSNNLTELGNKIKETNIQPYYRRGILKGIIDTNNQKYRLKRLGITVERVKELTREELRLRELKKLQSHRNNKNRTL